MSPAEAMREHREKAKRDHVSLLNAAEARGRTEVARNLKHMGLSLEAIEKATGLDTEAIKRL